MAERGGGEGDWTVDPEGNLSPPGSDVDTDEFGRTDPAALERERRRRERDERRKGKPPKKQKGAKKRGGGGGGLLGGRRRKEPPSEEAPRPATPQSSAAPEASEAPKQRRAKRAAKAAPPPPAAEAGTGERPAARAPAGADRPEPGEPAPVAAPAAGSGLSREAIRARLARRRAGGDDGGGGGGRPPRSASYKRRRAIALVAAVLGALLAWFLVALFQPFAGDGLGGERVAVNIPDGASAGQVADLLAEQGVVDNGTLFELRLKLSGKSGELVSGPVAMAEGMSYSAAIDRLTGKSAEEGRLVMPEGYSREQYTPIVEGAGVTGDYLASSEGLKGFDSAKYGAPKNPDSLEGFLFPATYELFGGETTDDLVGEQVAAFQANFKSVDMSYAEKKNLTPYDVLIIASMIEREVQVDKERPLVAAVIYNRLSKGEPLGIDATTRFEYNNWDQAITQAQLDKDTPYNTRLNVGLPPTPIGNPGLASIEAAARPAKVNYLFYVVDPGTCPATHSFTASQAEFDALVEEYNQAREEAGNTSPTC